MILGDSIVKRIQGQKLGRKVKQNVIMRLFPETKLDCMSYYAMSLVSGNPDRIIIHCGTNNLKMDESAETIAEKTIGLTKSAKSTTISNFGHHSCKDKLADMGSKVTNIIGNYVDETIKFTRQNLLM